jgi:hypothetical protein
MERISSIILVPDPGSLREQPGFGTLAYSPGATAVDPIAAVTPKP